MIEHEQNEGSEVLTADQRSLLSFIRRQGTDGINFRDIYDFWKQEDLDLLIQGGLIIQDEKGMLFHSLNCLKKGGAEEIRYQANNFILKASAVDGDQPENRTKTSENILDFDTSYEDYSSEGQWIR